MSRGSLIPLEDLPNSKCRRWRLQVSTGRDFSTGKYGKAQRRFNGTYSEAQRALRHFMEEIDENRTPDSRTHYSSFGDYARSWAERRDVAETTREKNRNQLKCLTMHLEHARLSDITPDVVESTFKKLRDGDSPSGERLSGTYLAGIRAMLSRIFKDAMRKGYIKSNPCDLVDTPKVDTMPRDALSEEQVQRLLEALRHDDPNHIACLLSLLAGLRRSECLSLRWRDIDFDGMTMHVHGTKTKASDDTVPILPLLADILEEWEASQKATGRHIKPESFVAAQSDGKPVEPLSLSRWWARNRDSFGLSGYTFHQLRHTFATMLARAGVHPASMQRLMRHSDARTTMQIYTHVSMEQEVAAINALDASIRH